MPRKASHGPYSGEFLEVDELPAHSGPSLSEALTRFVTTKKNGNALPRDCQELGRFVAWCGRDRGVAEVTPAEVADYAQHIGLGGPESVQRLNPVKVFLAYWKDEGWIQNGLAAHLRIPRTRRASGRAPARPFISSQETTHLSQEGYDRLASQLELLKEERIAIVQDIRRAMEDKDFRENAPLDAAKERQAVIESKIHDLEASLATAKILSERPARALRRSTLGAKVQLKDAASGKQVVYTLVDVREADASSGKISTTSPVGQALLDRSVGDEVIVHAPKGTLRYLVQRIDT